MTGVLAVVAPGPHTTVQDLGRPGYQAFGVPVSGALDPVSLRLANAVVGNRGSEGALEFLYTGPTLKVLAPSVRIAASAAPIEVLSDPPRRVAPWQSVRLGRGACFRIGAFTGAACGYLVVEGGFAVAPVLGSQSTYARGRIGGFEGRALREGDRLPLRRDDVEERGEVRLREPPDLTRPERVRVTLGPQQEYFADAAIASFLSDRFVVTTEADRMGLRLSGPRLAHARDYNIVSDGVATGAVQVPGSGQPIVLLADHQTTGGYPKIAAVISADWPALGRLKPGDELRFEEVTVGQAEDARRRLEADIGRRMQDLVPARMPGIVDEGALYAYNLVSGVVDSHE